MLTCLTSALAVDRDAGLQQQCVSPAVLRVVQACKHRHLAGERPGGRVQWLCHITECQAQDWASAGLRSAVTSCAACIFLRQHASLYLVFGQVLLHCICWSHLLFSPPHLRLQCSYACRRMGMWMAMLHTMASLHLSSRAGTPLAQMDWGELAGAARIMLVTG